MKVVFQDAIAYSPRLAGTAFKPPCSQRVLYVAIKNGELTTHKIGARNFILRSDLEQWIKSQPSTKKGHKHELH